MNWLRGCEHRVDGQRLVEARAAAEQRGPHRSADRGWRDLDGARSPAIPRDRRTTWFTARFYDWAGVQAREARSGGRREAAAKTAPARPARHTFNGYQLVWGDLHRHTDISEDGGIKDGSLLDTMRYAIDAAGLDFIGITDHTRYLPRRYNHVAHPADHGPAL